MPTAQDQKLRVSSARPDMTAAVMAETGLNEDMLRALVHGFYAKVRDDAELAPVFFSRVLDWDTHLDRMVDFWSSVALKTGRYHGAPIPKHAGLPVNWSHFERWLSLFRETAEETCTPTGAHYVIELAERIARSLHMAVKNSAQQVAE